MFEVSETEEAKEKIRSVSPTIVLSIGHSKNCKRAREFTLLDAPIICYIPDIFSCSEEGAFADFIWSGQHEVASKLIEVGFQKERIFGFYQQPPSNNWDSDLLSTKVLQRCQISLFRVALYIPVRREILKQQ